MPKNFVIKVHHRLRCSCTFFLPRLNHSAFFTISLQEEETSNVNEKIIAFVKEHKVLYDKSMRAYKNNNNRNKLWAQLASEIDMDGKPIRLFETLVHMCCIICAQNPLVDKREVVEANPP